MFTLLLFTNSQVLRTGFLSLVRSQDAIRICTVRGRISDLMNAIDAQAPDVLLFDFVAAEDFPGLAAVRRRAAACKTVLWVDAIQIEAGYQAMKLGVRGILKKSDDFDYVLSALEHVSEGRMCFGQSLIADFLEAKTVGLTPRESQLVPLVARGLKNKEIAAALELSEATVRIYLSALFRKLGVRDRHELAIHAIKNLPSGEISSAPEGGHMLQSMMMGKAAAAGASS